MGGARKHSWGVSGLSIGKKYLSEKEVPYIFEYRWTSNISRGKFLAINQGFFIASNISRAEK